METTIVYWCYIGRMEKKMETTIMGLPLNGLYRGYIGKEAEESILECL